MATACRGSEASHTVTAREFVLALRSTAPAAGAGSPFLADQVRPTRAVVSRTSVASHNQVPKDKWHILEANHRLQATASVSHIHQVKRYVVVCLRLVKDLRQVLCLR